MHSLGQEIEQTPINFFVKHSCQGRMIHNFFIALPFTDKNVKLCDRILWRAMKDQAKLIRVPIGKRHKSKWCTVQSQPTIDGQIKITFTFKHNEFWLYKIWDFNRRIRDDIAVAISNANEEAVEHMIGAKPKEFRKKIRQFRNRIDWNNFVAIFDERVININPANVLPSRMDMYKAVLGDIHG